MANKEMTMKELNEFQLWCAEILPVVQAGINGCVIQFYDELMKEWSNKKSLGFHDDVKYRIKPRTITVNGFEVPEPMQEAPTAGAEYFTPNITGDELWARANWNSDRFDKRWLSRGLCHTTNEAAIAHAKAMLGIDPNGYSK